MMLSISTLAVFTTLTVEAGVFFFKLVTVIRCACTYIHSDQARREIMGQGRLPCSLLCEYSTLSYMELLSAVTGTAGSAFLYQHITLSSVFQRLFIYVNFSFIFFFEEDFRILTINKLM
jgi:hypothetical protein